MGQNPFLRLTFSLCDQFQRKTVGIIVVFEGVLKSYEFGVVSSENVHVAVEHPFVLLESTVKLLPFIMNMSLKFFNKDF